MTQIEQIKAEIERLKEEAFDNIKDDSKRSMVSDVANSRQIAVCEQLLTFINSLPAEKRSGGLEKAAKEYAKENGISPKNCHDGDIPYYEKQTAAVFIAGANWQKQQAINKACKWLNKNVVEYHPRTGELKPVVNINAFREAMEKEGEQC